MISKYWTIDKKIPIELIEHIKSSTFFMTSPQISQCIDWRRTKNESNYWMSIPGWWIGLLAVMLSVIEDTIIANNDKNYRKKILNILFDVVWWEENMSFHTDEEHICGWIGCWHIELILKKENRDLYWLSDKSTKFIEKTIKKYQDKAIINILKWKHEERWIIKVYSTHHSIHANNNWSQYFIYTPKILSIINKEIARKIYKEFIEWTSISITANSIASMLQTKMDLNFENTIKLLAPTLPRYRLKHSICWNIKLINKIK
mgnify:FL=1